MSWLTRASPPHGGRAGSGDEALSPDAAVERGAPGLAALLESLREDGRHSMLDLGTASGAHLRFLGRFARRIRFAALVPSQTARGDERSAIETLQPNPGRPYDVVLAWDVLDQLDPSGRLDLIARLSQITAPKARLYTVVSASTEPTVRSVRSTILACDRVSMTPAGPARPAPEPLLPAAVERLLPPFEITHAFTLRVGLREYVAIKREP